MDLAGKIIKHINYPLWVYKNRSSRLKFLRESEVNQFLPLDQLKDLQWKRLSKILEHSYNNIPFYRKRFDSLNIRPKNITSITDFKKIPLLSKKDIQENLVEMKASNYRETDLIKDITGGSTGSPLVFYYTKERRDSREAATIRHNRWAGWDIGDKSAILWGAARDFGVRRNLKNKVRDFLLNRILCLDASSITEERMYYFAEELKKIKPSVILAYANTLYLFARFLEKNKITGINPKSIVCSAEVLLPENRKFIESIFNCKIFNRYGCREFAVIASECDRHNGMHINADALYVEFLKNGADVPYNETGEIVITDLLNYGMPLIRYRIGDAGKPLKGICGCGRSLPLIDAVEGRVTDFIRTPDNKMISGVALVTYVITNIQGIGQVQLIQEKIDTLKVKIIKNNLFSHNTEKLLLEKLNKFLEYKLSIQVEYVDSIPNELSGKYRFTISNLIEY